MSLSFLCSYVTPIIAVLQSIVDAVFGAFSFLGVSAPSITSLVNSLLGCTTQ